MVLRDAHNRIIRDLRLSLTDRCNFRCFYCLPNGEPPLARKETILTFEEITEICEIFVQLGIEKIRLTGGEPLLRKDVEVLVEKLAKLKALRITNYELRGDGNPNSKFQIPKLVDLALTTNGFSLKERAKDLKNAGLDRVTISLDSLKRENFRKITGVDKLGEVLQAIKAAQRANLNPIKINAVIVRGYNDNEIVDFAKFARENDLSFRFIEFMPLDAGHEWRREMVVPGKEIRAKINQVFPLKLKKNSRGSETAWKYEFADGGCGEIGIIAPVTEMFCGACSRIRLTADGQIRTCLFSTAEHNLRDVLRSGARRAEVVEFIKVVVLKKEARHHINDAEFVQPQRTMSFIGG
ncbi:MAG: GTP 3',8-cyclase MoaA [Acidobacteria bacterium]|jgi:cyclic pyranopterin phosphate synthase|nr:GTP 3',8-cyclase MoaA [Acidobacteriota bacterium]